ncbi:hypothetical protein DTO027B9_2429 [Paecilomyces variotii]|nr:hypothetical protein DTO027B9_2429 [Paecilomyces variotii]
MPMIMEEGIDVDDLFGDPSSLELGLSSTTATKGLAQRLDEMRLVGCCQKVAWSRLGCIAYISQDGLRVNVRHLYCRPTDGKWTLSEDTPLTAVTEAHGSHPLAHLSWNETGSELAVVDSSGRVSIYAISIALNSISGQRQAVLDADDDGGQIVGMMWLNLQRIIHAFHQAAKLNGRWGYSPFRRRPIGPFHPVNKSALVCITRSAQIRLLYQNPDSRWAEVSTELKHTAHSDGLLTHAALAPIQGGIILATHSACQKISVYRVNITWNPPQWDPNQPKQVSAAAPFPTPTLRFLHSKIETSSGVFDKGRSGLDHSDDLSHSANSLYCLTRLDIVPGPSESTAGSASGPWIIAVFSSPVHVSEDHHQQQHHQQQQQGASSIIVRWQLETAAQSLHPKFDEVVSKKSNAQTKPRIDLRRLEDVYSDRYIVSVDHTEYGNVLSVTYDDSSIAFYDPKTMTNFNGVDDTNTVTSMAQAGFHFPLDASGIHISFSPNACLAVVLDADWQMRLRTMEHSFGAEEGLYDDSKFSAAVAALALAFCRGCGSDTNTDDIVMMLLRQLTPDAQSVFVSEVYRALPINCNFTVEHDKLMQHPFIPRCLSVQAALGFKEYSKPRTLPAAVPWSILHLRHASVLFAYFFQYNKGAREAEPHDPDVLRMILGNTKWALGFANYILDELFDLQDEFQSVFSDQEAFAQKVKSASSLSLLILLCSMSRAFLRFICRGLRGVYAGFAAAHSLSGEARVVYAEICRAISASPVRIDVYEKFLAGVDSAVRHAYQGAGFGDAERPAPEKELLTNARIPAVLVPAVATLLRQTLPSIKPEIDRMGLYLADYSWLGIGYDRRTELYRRSREVDILKKVPLRTSPTDTADQNGDSNRGKSAIPRRRCTRCGEVSGDVTPPRSFLWFRLVAKLGILRSCLCGGMWTLEPGSATVPMLAHQQHNPARTPAATAAVLPGSA